MPKIQPEMESRIIQEVMRQAVKDSTVNVSTKKVAKALHISEPVIFAHFKTKEALVRETFFKAWEAFNKPLIPMPPETLTTKDIHYDFFKTVYVEELKNKKEIPFIIYYLGSGYYCKEDVMKAQESRRDDIKAILLRVYGERKGEDLDVLITIFLENFVRAFYDLLTGEIPDTERNRRLIFSEVTLGINGFMEKSGELREN